MSFGALAVTSDGHVREGLLISEVLEGSDHVGLEVVPAEAELLVVMGSWPF